MKSQNKGVIDGIAFAILPEYIKLYQQNHKIRILIQNIMSGMKSIYFAFDYDLKITTDSSVDQISGKVLLIDQMPLDPSDLMIKITHLIEFVSRLRIKFPEVNFELLCNNYDIGDI